MDRVRTWLFRSALALIVVCLSLEFAGNFMVSHPMIRHAMAQAGDILRNGMIFGKLRVNGDTPTVTGGTLAAGSTDFAGQITATGGGVQTVTLTFSSAWTAAPLCRVNNESVSSNGPNYSTSNSALTMNFGVTPTSQKINYLCVSVR